MTFELVLILAIATGIYIYERERFDRITQRNKEKENQAHNTEETETKELQTLKDRLTKVELSVGLRPPQNRNK